MAHKNGQYTAEEKARMNSASLYRHIAWVKRHSKNLKKFHDITNADEIKAIYQISNENCVLLVTCYTVGNEYVISGESQVKDEYGWITTDDVEYRRDNREDANELFKIVMKRVVNETSKVERLK